MFLPTIYTSFLLAAFSWANALPANFQLPIINWPTQNQQIISPQPPQMAYPTSLPTPTTKPTLTPTPTKVLTNKVTPTPTKRPTPTPTKTPLAVTTPKPTIKPSVTPKPTTTPTVKPTTVPTATVTSLLDQKQQYILDQINEYRAENGLSAVKAEHYTCDFAKTRSQEIVNNFNHDGFITRANAHTLPYPSYHNVTENIAETSDYTQVVTMWKNSAGHAANMRSDTPYVCVAYTGNYYAYEGCKP